MAVAIRVPLKALVGGCFVATAFFRDKGASTAANELYCQWAVRFSTAHRQYIRRALYLPSSDEKFCITSLFLGKRGLLSL